MKTQKSLQEFRDSLIFRETNTFNGTGAASQGIAQAKAVVFFVLVAGLGLAQLAYTRNKEVQQ